MPGALHVKLWKSLETLLLLQNSLPVKPLVPQSALDEQIIFIGLFVQNESGVPALLQMS